MENRRFILICVFGVLLFLIYQAWQQEQAAPAGERPSTVDEMELVAELAGCEPRPDVEVPPGPAF